MQPSLNIAISAARIAGNIIMRYIDRLDSIKTMVKNEREWFSEVDLKAEEAIIATLQKAYPHHGFIAEESGAINPDAESVWIIDPLDGTTNYLRGFPFFCVSIAQKVKGRIEHAVVYDPLRQECFSASRGSGARLNNRRIRVSRQIHLQEAMIGASFSFRSPEIAEQYLPLFQAMQGKTKGVRRTGAAALDLAYVAAGRLDGYWILGLKPWDIAAASLLIKEAGGLISDIEGGEKYLQTGDIVAGTPKIFKALLQHLLPIRKK